MNTDSFITLTTEAFDNIAIQFGLTQKISKQEITYSSLSYTLSIYFENYFEINIFFSFNYEKTEISLNLNDLAKYLSFDEQTVQHIQHNQIFDKEYYKYYIRKMAEICEQVIKMINLDSSLMSNCYYWKEKNNNDLNNNYSIVHIENMLNQLWHKKEYSKYYDYYFEHLIQIQESRIKHFLKARAEFAKKKAKHR